MSTVAVWRIDIESTRDGRYYGLVNAIGEEHARKEAKHHLLMLGDRITEVSGPFYWPARKWARYIHGAMAS